MSTKAMVHLEFSREHYQFLQTILIKNLSKNNRHHYVTIHNKFRPNLKQFCVNKHQGYSLWSDNSCETR